MTDEPSRDAATPDLDLLLTDYVERMNRGEILDKDRITDEHPDLAGELIERLEFFLEIGEPAATQTEQPGLGVVGDYVLRRQIGRGGMGVVYEARQHSLDRRVALKILPAGLAADDKAFQRFMREAKTAAKLQHPYVVGVYGMGVEQHTPYYAMEYVEGQTLAEVLAGLEEAGDTATTPFGTLTDQDYYIHLARAFAEVAGGLQHAHSRGVVHRDIKPSNLILDSEDRLRILDFGLAHLEGQESLTATGGVVGTPLYMSPEQVRRRKTAVDHRTDIWSLGATLYEALVGRPPFRGKDHGDTLSRILERDPTEPHRLNARVPRDLETIVLKCLRKEPRDRYGTAEALAQDLQRFVRGDPIEARPIGRSERLLRRLRAHRQRVAFLTMGLLLVVLVTYAGLAYLVQRREEKSEAYEQIVRGAVSRLQLGVSFGVLRSSVLEGRQRHADDFFAGSVPFVDEAAIRERVEGAILGLERAATLVPDRPEAYYYRARGFLVLDEYAGALQELERAVSCDPAFAPARTLRAIIHERQGQSELARAELERAVEVARAPWVESWFQAHTASKAKSWALAEKHYSDLLNQSAGLDRGVVLDTRVGRGIARLEQKNLDGATRDLVIACHEWPEALGPGLLLGHTYLLIAKERGEGSAEAWFAEFWQSFSATNDALRDDAAFAIATVYLWREDVDSALEWVQRMTPSRARDLMYLDLYLWSQRWDDAIRVAEEIAAREPLDAYLLARLGHAWSLVPGGKTRAEVFFDRALGSIGADPDPRLCRFVASGYFNLLDWQKAGHYAQLAWNATGDDAWCRFVITCLYREAKWAEAVEAGRKCLEAGASGGSAAGILGLMGRASMPLGRFEDAETNFRSALEIGEGLSPPEQRAAFLGYTLSSLGQLEIDRGNFDLGERYLREARDRFPYELTAPWRLAELMGRLKRDDEALEFFCEAISRDLSSVALSFIQSFLDFLRRGPVPDNRECLDGVVGILDDFMDQERVDRRFLELYALVLLHAPERGDLEQAAHYARRAVEEGEWGDWRSAQSLASIHHARGDLRETVQVLEEISHPFRLVPDRQLLEACREQLLPDLSSFASIDALLERWTFDRAQVARILEDFRRTADPGGAAARLDYLDARVLQLEGRHGEAVPIYRKLAAQLIDHSEPVSRGVECWMALGEYEEPREFLGRLLTGDVSPRQRRVIENCAWICGRFADGAPIRINCGSQEDRPMPGGDVWSRDRFASGGLSAGTDLAHPLQTLETDVAIGETLRYFPMYTPRPAYRIPVPPGHYELRFYFAEDHDAKPGRRVFSVIVEDRTVLANQEPLREGFGVLHGRWVGPVEVVDGAMDIAFHPVSRARSPSVVGIEIEPATVYDLDCTLNEAGGATISWQTDARVKRGREVVVHINGIEHARVSADVESIDLPAAALTKVTNVICVARVDGYGRPLRCAVALPSPPAQGDALIDEDFESAAPGSCPPGFRCNSSAVDFSPMVTPGGRLRLAQEGALKTATSVILEEPVDLSHAALEIDFDAFVSVTGEAVAADGFTFALLDASVDTAASVGVGGGGMGYEGLSGLAVELDLWQGRGEPSGANVLKQNFPAAFSHVALVKDGRTERHLQSMLDLDRSLRPRAIGGSGWPDVVGRNGTDVPLHFRVIYDSAHLQVFLSAPATSENEPPLSDVKVLDTVVLMDGGCGEEFGGFELGKTLLGFTASTGKATATVEIDNLRVRRLGR